jgi:ABC-2 type transport system ATP-binding protein
MIRIENLIKEYKPDFKFEIPGLKINKEACTAIVGNNGAGKTTLLNLILDLVEPDTGIIEINSINNKKTEWKAFTGSYLDENFLFDFLYPLEYLKFISVFYNIGNDELIKRLELFRNFIEPDLIFKNKKLIGYLSEGNKEKLGIISALIINPLLIILDEPYSRLDPTSRTILSKILIYYKVALKSTLLISSHDLYNLAHICDRIILVEDGKVKLDELTSATTFSRLNNYFREKSCFNKR